jgi:MerR family transcriptional regulator, light-induced transcriptional regulator
LTSPLDYQRRAEVAAAIRAHRAAVAEEVTNQFLLRHPDWLERYGDRAHRFGMEDAGYHQDFLAAAIESGEVEAFREYCAWAARMLKGRAIEANFLAENLEQIGHSFWIRLPQADAAVVDRFIRSGVERCLSNDLDSGPPAAGAFHRLMTLYTDAAFNGNRQPALNLLLEAIRQGASVIEIYSEVLQHAMHRVGRLWEEGRITVAQEHMATAVTQFALANLYPLIDQPEILRGKIVITGVAGEFHQVGSNMVADALEASGWDVQFLGTDAPDRGVLQAIEQHQPSIVGISATMLFNISSVARLVKAIRARFGDSIRVMLGGGAFRSTPSLYKEIGADACGLDLQAAVRISETWA